MHSPKIVEQLIKIQSVSDLITNSSSEVFIVYTKEGIQFFKNIVSTLIGDNFDNHFNLEIVTDDYYAPKEYMARPDNYRDMSFENWCFLHDSEYLEDSPFVKGFVIIAKDPKDIDKANKLNQTYSVFKEEIWLQKKTNTRNGE